MRIVPTSFVSVALFVALVAPTELEARPMHTPLETVLERSTHIVVVEDFGPVDTAVSAYEAPQWRLEVTESLRGDREPGAWIVDRGKDGTPVGRADGSFVAFVDAEGVWNFSAIPQSDGPLGDTWFEVTGFYDFNAHLVSPSLLTWSQLEGLVAGVEPSDSRFEGAIWALDEAGFPVATDVEIEVEVSLDGERFRAAGLPRADGLPRQPRSVTISPGWDPDVSLAYGHNSNRPLEIHGEIVGVDDGVFVTRFRVDRPNLITAALLDDYLADGGSSGVRVELRATLDDGTTLDFAWSDGVQRRTGPIVSSGDSSVVPDDLVSRGVSYAPTRVLSFDNGSQELAIQVDAPSSEPARISDRGGADMGYLYELLQNGGLECSVRLVSSGTDDEIWSQRGHLGVVSLELAPNGEKAEQPK